MPRKSRLPFGPKEAYSRVDPADPDYPRAVVDYCCADVLIEDRQVMQVYEELLHFAYWLHGFRPNNVLEIGTVGGMFFVLSRLSTGKKVSVDIRDIRARIHNFMFDHDWKFFQGNSQTQEMHSNIVDYCESFDLIFIDGDHRYEGVQRDFELYKSMLSERGVIVFHDVDPQHAFKDKEGGQVYKFWEELDEGSKTSLCCTRSTGRVRFLGRTHGFGGLGLWRPR